MTESTQRPMTAGTTDQRSRAAEMTRQRRIAEGRDPDAPTRGPVPEMLAAAGFSPAAIRRVGRNFGTGDDMANVIGPERAAAFVDSFGAFADAMEAGG